MVCATCLEKNRARDALEDRLIYITDLECDGQYDAALACLDEILEANGPYDHDLWLARSIAMHRSGTLFSAGRYAEAEKACEAWAQLGFQDVWRRWMHGFRKAETLDALGRPREALEALEDALSHQEPREIPSAGHMLVAVAELSEKLGQPVDPKWRSLTEAWAKHHGVEMPVDDSLGKAIVEVNKIIRARDPELAAIDAEEDELAGGEP
jgi:tetratricopeptide (TPR) repeat protein